MKADADPDGNPSDWLAPSQLERLKSFLGYGNPAGRYCFIGIEERGAGSPDRLRNELLVRAEHYEPIEDLKRAMELPAFGSTFKVSDYVRTWAIISKIVLCLDGDPDWRTNAVKYQAEHLGRRDGETFLTDLLPLPAASASQWPYTQLYPTRVAYEAAVLPGRITALRALLEQHRPAFVFCYGKEYWPRYQRLFPNITEYESVVNDSLLLGRMSTGTLVILTPFFAPFAMSHARIEGLALRLRQDRFIWHEGDVTIVPPASRPSI